MSDNNAWPVAKRTEEITYAVRDIILVADQAKAAGKDMIYLNIGDPNIYDFDTPPELIDAACEAMRNNKNGYAPSPGIPSALEAIRADAERKGVKNVRDVFTSYGASEAIETCLAALADPGDNIIIPSPGYPLYAALNSKLNLQSKFYPLNEDNDWQPDVEYIGKCIDERTKAIVLINPNNPTGAVYSREVLLGIIELARKHRLVIFSDEIYDRLIFDGNKHIPTASLADDVPIVTFNGLSKCYLSPGWRIGWAVISGPQHIQSYIEAMQKMVRARLCINHPLQYAIPVALEGEHKHLPPAIKKLQERRDIVCDRLNKITGISCVKPKGTFYVFPKIEIDVADDKFIKELVLETGVVLVPGSGFGKLASAGHFRLVFLPKPEILEKACSNIENFMQKYLKT